MPQQFSGTERLWCRIPAFERDGVTVSVMTFDGDDHSAATTVFTNTRYSEVWHADKYCHLLHQGPTITGPAGEMRTVYARPLECVMTSSLGPSRPCEHCTQDIGTTAEIVQKHDGVPKSILNYTESGDSVAFRTPNPATEQA